MFSRLEHTPVASFCLTFGVCFYELNNIATSPSLEGVGLCGNILCVDCLSPAALAGWLELEWVQVKDNPRMCDATAALARQLELEQAYASVSPRKEPQ